MRPASSVFSVLLALLALATLAPLAGCQREVGPQLIEVLDIAPREVERGDRVELIGTSFPQGKKGHVTFRGALNRPGEKPATAEIASDATATSSTQIEIEVTESLEALFCGAAERSIHTTFTGDVELAFPAATQGAPPVSATLHGVTLDVRPPSPRRALLAARTKEGENVLAFLGMRASKTAPASGGILIDAVTPGSRAEKAAIQAGDLLVELDHVRLDSAADMIPSGSAPVAHVTVRRGSSPTETKHDLDVAGLRVTPPVDLYGAALVLLIVASFLLLFLAPTAGLLTWIERRIAGRMKAAPDQGFASLSDALRTLMKEDAPPPAGRGPLFRSAPYLVFAAVSAIFVVMPFGQYLIAADLDVGILYVLAVTSLVTIGLLSGGWAQDGTSAPEARRGPHQNHRYSLLGGIRTAAQILSYEVPGAIAVACIVMMTGSLRMQEIIHAQGGWPWEWYLFKSPVTFALFFLYFTTALAQGSRAPFDLPEAESDAAAPAVPVPVAGRSGLRYAFLFFAEWANVFVMGGIAAALFLGGWQVPGLSAGAEEAHVALQVLGAVVFLLKAWLVILGVLWIRWALPRLRMDQRMLLCWKWLVPMAFAAFALSAGWVAWSPGRTAQLVMGVGMFTVSCVGAARFAQRVRFNLAGADANARLNPFL